MMRLWDNGNDFVIAESAEEAFALWLEHTGESRDTGYSADEYTAWDDDRVFTFADEDVLRTSKTAAEWVAEHGRGYFASRDY